MTPLHASCITFGNQGLLIIGKSGSGKSALALQLIGLGATLIADDGVILTPIEGRLKATCPPAIQGMIEARGIGLLATKFQPATFIAYVIDMDRPEPDRLPPHRTHTLSGVEVDLVLGKDTPNLAPALSLLLQNGRIA